MSNTPKMLHFKNKDEVREYLKASFAEQHRHEWGDDDGELDDDMPSLEELKAAGVDLSWFPPAQENQK